MNDGYLGKDLYECVVCGARGFFPSLIPEGWHQIRSYDDELQWVCGVCHDPAFAKERIMEDTITEAYFGERTHQPTINVDKSKPPSVLDDPYSENGLTQSMSNTFDECWALAKRKNHDYAGDDDPLANFRECEKIGISVPQGIMVRLTDKIARLQRLLTTEAAVTDETVHDTIMDAINYLAILDYARKQ